VGCGSSDPPDSNNQAASEIVIPASTETTSELGVDHWGVSSPEDFHLTITGYDSSSRIVTRYDSALREAGDGLTGEMVGTAYRRKYTMQFAVTANGIATFQDDHFHGHPEIVYPLWLFDDDRAAAAAQKSSGGTGGLVNSGSLVKSLSLSPMDNSGTQLVTDGQHLMCEWDDCQSLVGAIYYNCGNLLIGLATTTEYEGPVSIITNGSSAVSCTKSGKHFASCTPHYDCGPAPCTDTARTHCLSSEEETLHPLYFGSNTQLDCFHVYMRGHPESPIEAAQYCGCRIDATCPQTTQYCNGPLVSSPHGCQ
jgi:hypothetical protein